MQSKQSSGSEGSAEFPVGFIPHKSGTYRIEINDGIYNVGQFSTAIMVLENATPDDDVEIHLQAPGGCVNSTDAFIHALRKCRANVHMVATGGCHSAITHILLEADTLELSSGFNACLHCGSDGAYGNVNEYRIKAKFDEAFRDKQFRETYEGFLSDKEMTDMLNGIDIWLNGEQWMERAIKRHEHFTAKMEAMLNPKPARKPRAKKTIDNPK